MSFLFRVRQAQYREGRVFLLGVLESGSLDGCDPIRIPTAGGGVFATALDGMEWLGEGREPPPWSVWGNDELHLILPLRDPRPQQDILVPCVAEG